jgi:3-oxoacyl-[acyl-carrier protein] reductase
LISIDDIYIGQKVIMRRQITSEIVDAFAQFSGDYNPLHMEEDFARHTTYQRRVAHGMITASYVSTLIGMQLPGAGALWNQQSFRWKVPVFIGDELEISLTVQHKSQATNTLIVDVKAINQNGVVVMDGEGVVMIPEERKKQQNQPDMPASEQVILVTGGSRGIGAAIARAFGKAGARVIVNYAKNSLQAEEICQSILDDGGQAIAIQADVTNMNTVADMNRRVLQKFGQPVDILINNASGAINAQSFLDLDWDEIQSHIDVQVRGAFYCCKAVIPAMLEKKSGCIVNIGSITTWSTPTVNWTGYILAKSALKSLTRSLAMELGPKGIRVNMVSPGMTETDLIADVPERLRKVQAMQTPLRRLALAEDVAGTVQFLCSKASQHITGADIPVGGGISM